MRHRPRLTFGSGSWDEGPWGAPPRQEQAEVGTLEVAMTSTPSTTDPLLEAILNLSRFHREHEKFYASAPRERAVRLQRHARTLHALADRWSSATPSTAAPLSPYAGAEDLNDPAALQLEGVLFMEGEGKPAELASLIRDLRATADDYARHRRLAGQGHAGVLGHRRRARRHPWPRRSPRRPAPDHRQRLARRRHERAHRDGCSRVLRTSSTASTTRRPRCAPTSPGHGARRSLLHSAAETHQPGRRPVQRLRRSRQRQRAAVASLPRTSSSDRRVESISRRLGAGSGET